MRSRCKLLLLILCMISCNCVFTPTEPVSHSEFFEVFNALWLCTDSNYCRHREEAVDWEECYSKHLLFCNQSENETELRQVLMDMLTELRDQEIFLYADSQQFRPYQKEYSENYRFSVISSYLEPYGGLTMVGSSFSYSNPENGLSYIQIREMSESFPMSSFKQVIDTLFINSNALILDLRPCNMNRGSGSELAIAGCFSSEAWTGWFYRELLPEVCDFPEPYIVEPDGGVFFQGDVILLTGEFCFGAGELFASCLKALPSVTVIGEYTRGLLVETVPYSLPNQWTLNLPSQLTYSTEMVLINNVGVKPHVIQFTTPVDLNRGLDPILELALQMAGVNEP